jgi:hypothetical protein
MICQHIFIAPLPRRCVHCGVSQPDFEKLCLDAAITWPWSGSGALSP